MTDAVQRFYDDLTEVYDLIYADWPASVRRQGDVLDRLIAAELGEGARDILDAACGIGTQAIGLALRGHRVSGTDLSPASIGRARRESDRFGVSLSLGVADLRSIADGIPGTFDVVVACDNALPHLLSAAEVRQAVANMAATLRPGGRLLASIRDYDALLAERPTGEPPRVVDGPDGRRITFQVWDWDAGGLRYRLSQFILRQQGDGWRTDYFATEYRALTRVELTAAAEAAGLIDVRWHEADVTGFHQPIVSGRRA